MEFYFYSVLVLFMSALRLNIIITVISLLQLHVEFTIKLDLKPEAYKVKTDI
jgi:hypothetical protein